MRCHRRRWGCNARASVEVPRHQQSGRGVAIAASVANALLREHNRRGTVLRGPGEFDFCQAMFARLACRI